ncbi:unnamed protein product [Lampetra planeri]
MVCDNNDGVAAKGLVAEMSDGLLLLPPLDRHGPASSSETTFRDRHQVQRGVSPVSPRAVAVRSESVAVARPQGEARPDVWSSARSRRSFVPELGRDTLGYVRSGTKLRLERADDQTDVRPRLALRPSVEDRSGLNRDRAWAHGGHPTLNLVPITDRRRAR